MYICGMSGFFYFIFFFPFTYFEKQPTVFLTFLYNTLSQTVTFNLRYNEVDELVVYVLWGEDVFLKRFFKFDNSSEIFETNGGNCGVRNSHTQRADS